MVKGNIPQLIRLLRYRLVAYSRAMFACPPRTFWQDAACSRAEPSPGLTANIALPRPVSLMNRRNSSGVGLPSVQNEERASERSAAAPPPARSSSRWDSRFWTALARATYPGSFLDNVNSASFNGLER